MLGNSNFVNPTRIRQYKSPWQPLSANTEGTISIPSSVFKGLEPDSVVAELQVVSAVANYSVGDIIKFDSFHAWDAVSSVERDYGMTLALADDNVTVSYAIGVNGVLVINKTTNIVAGIGSGSLNFRIVATRFELGDQPDITRVGLVPLEKKVVTSGDADVQFNLQQWFNDYEDFEIEFKSLGVVTDGVEVRLRTSSDGGVTFDSGASDYNISWNGTQGGASTNGGNTSSSGAFSIFGLGTLSDEKAYGTCLIVGPEDPNSETYFLVKSSGRRSTAAFYTVENAIRRTSVGATDVIQLFAGSGNLEQGTFILYGKRKVI